MKYQTTSRDTFRSLGPLVVLGLLILPAWAFKPFRGPVIPQAPSDGERKPLISRLRLPVNVTAVRNLQSANWIEDLEIEVQNNSSKPIYHLMVVLSFPDIRKSTEVDGVSRGIVIALPYGRLELMNR